MNKRFFYEIENMIVASQSCLPMGYRRTEYIESTGAQSMELPFVQTDGSIVEVKIEEMATSSKDMYLYGVNSGQRTCVSYINNSVLYFSAGSLTSSDSQCNSHITVNQRYLTDITYNDNEKIINGTINEVQLTPQVYTGALLNTNFRLFGPNGGSNNFIGRVYQFQLTENGSLLFDYVPVIRNSDNRPGLYNLVDGSFNTGVGIFLVSELDINISLPIEYTQIEYIQSTGTQYIDTGVNISNLSQIVIDFQYTKSNDNQWFCGTNMDFEGGIYGTKFYSSAGFIYSQSRLTNRTIATGTTTNNSSTSVYLFGRNWSGSMKCSSMKVFLCKVHDRSNNLIRDYVPCLRNSDSKPGLYDRVNNIFYTNLGTDEFLYS